MPDGPRYDDDFFAWTQYQADVLRSLRTEDNRFDRENLVEEVESLGRSERDAVRRILMHFLKLTHSPAGSPRAAWMRSIVEARAELEDKLSTSLRRDAEERLSRLYAAARKSTLLDLETYDEHEAAQILPVICPYTIEQVVADDWYPDAASTQEQG